MGTWEVVAEKQQPEQPEPVLFLRGESAVGVRNGPFQSSLFWMIDCLVVFGTSFYMFGQFDNNTPFSKSVATWRATT